MKMLLFERRDFAAAAPRFDRESTMAGYDNVTLQYKWCFREVRGRPINFDKIVKDCGLGVGLCGLPRCRARHHHIRQAHAIPPIFLRSIERPIRDRHQLLRARGPIERDRPDADRH